MKAIIILLLTTALTCIAFGDNEPELQIATYDNNKLQKQIGYDSLRELEYGLKYRKSIIDLKQRLAVLEDRLIAAENDEELKRINLELSFIRSKMSSIQSLARARASRSNDRIALTALIKDNFAKKYAIILQSNSGSNAFHSAIHANVKYVDITDEIVNLVRKELSVEK